MTYRWDSKRRQYIDERGRAVPPKRIREHIEEFIASQKEEFSIEAGKMVVGAVTVPFFFSWMRDQVKAMHGAAGVIAYGGEAEMNAERWQRIELKILSEFEYLVGFRADVEAESALETMLWPQDRATKYADSVYSTYANSEKAREGDAGLISARRVCVDDESSCEDCPLLATDDYLPLNEVADIGDSQCASRCRCWLEFDYARIEPIEIDRNVYA